MILKNKPTARKARTPFFFYRVASQIKNKEAEVLAWSGITQIGKDLECGIEWDAKFIVAIIQGTYLNRKMQLINGMGRHDQFDESEIRVSLGTCYISNCKFRPTKKRAKSQTHRLGRHRAGRLSEVWPHPGWAILGSFSSSFKSRIYVQHKTERPFKTTTWQRHVLI